MNTSSRLQHCGNRQCMAALPARHATQTSHARGPSHARSARAVQTFCSPMTQVGVATSTVTAETYPDLRNLTKDDYYSFIEEAGDKLVVIDFYTDWCGPCKLIYPRLCEIAANMQKDVAFARFNCNKYNKELGVELGIRVAPTFFLYKNKVKVAEMTGAKVDQLMTLINKNI